MRLSMACIIFVFASCHADGGGMNIDPGDSGGGDDLGPGGTSADMAPEMMPPGSNVLRLTVVDGETGFFLPSRVLITAVEPTRPIAFDIDKNGVSAKGDRAVRLGPGVLGAPEGLMLEAGTGAVHLPQGIYDVMVTHGPEWEAVEQRVSITPGRGVDIDAVLDRTVDTTGWLAADLHIHTGRSYDSTMPVQDRVVTEVSVGVELLVTTDHNVMSDLQPDVVRLGYESIARAIVGNEFNFDPGHGGAYPMPYDPMGFDSLGAPDGGATKIKLDWERARFMLIGQMYDYLQKVPGWGPVAVTVNHPRMGGSLGFFENLFSPRYGPAYGPVESPGWHPPTKLEDAGKFDGLEVMSGYMMQPAQMQVILRDWFFLLSSGTRVTGLGSSDTHRLRGVKAGFPRTWLRMSSDDPTRVADVELVTAIKKGRAIASNGPFITLNVAGGDIGDLVKVVGKTVDLDVTVDAPSWIDLDKARIFINGKQVKELPIAGPKTRPRLNTRVTGLPLPAGDAWVVVQASGKKPLPLGLIGDDTLDGERNVVPFAITNPVFLDVDGDGNFDPRLSLPDADPGPLGPLAMPDPMPMLDDGAVRHNRIPQDCEPPLWVNPATWVNP